MQVQHLEDLELKSLLNGRHDGCGAIMTLYARDGGTDANDWAEMMVRMYSQWAANYDYSVDLIDRSDNQEAGINIVRRALQAPIRQIAENAGVDGSVVAEMVREKGKSIGYNALTGEYEDMFKAGVIDPSKVVRSALQNAASISGLLLTTDSMITDLKNDHSVEGSVA